MILQKLLILVFLAVAVCVMGAGVGAAAVITVDDSGGAMYTSIQAAIDDASLGDEIHVDSGTYYENVVVNKQLILRGIDTGFGMPVVDTGGSGSAITLNTDGIILEGFDVRNSGNGIYVTSNYNTLTNNTASNNYYGIYLYSSSNNNTLTSNNVSNNNYYGILLHFSSNNTLTNNTAINNNNGIYLYYSNNNTIYQNDFIDNLNYNAYDINGNNQWDLGTTGNYYSDYIGTDSDGDSIGDTSYPIFGGSSVDWYPLMEPKEPTIGPVHNINKSTNHTTIQAAINAARPGDEIHVDSGTYYENVVVNKQVTLRGIDTGAGMPVVDAGGITLNTDGIILDGFNVRNSGNGIYVTSNYNTLTNNNVSNNNYGIYLYSSSNNTLTDNTISNNANGILLHPSSNNNTLTNNTASNNNYGIYLYSSNNNTLTDNTVSNNSAYGIYFYSSSNNTLTDNAVSNNSAYGIYLYYSSNNNLTSNIFVNDGLIVFFSYQNTVENNMVNGKPLVYLEDSSDYVIIDAGQAVVVNCTNITVDKLVLSNSIVGIELWQTNNSIISDNVINDNYYGIFLYSSSNNSITNNTVINNSNGIYLYSSSKNTIYQNNLNNTNYNAYDNNGNNQWDWGTIGNYYSDYTGTDSNGDGIGDTPYSILGGSSVDSYPLMEPWTNIGPVHNINKGTNYRTIQAAINAASPGDEIHVDSGEYHENVNVNKQLILRGIDTGEGKPVVNASNEWGTAITLSAGWTTLEGFNVRNSSSGISVASSNNLLQNNIVTNNNYNGISLGYSSSNNTLKNNSMSGNRYNFDINIYWTYQPNNISIDNRVDGKYIYYLNGVTDIVIDDKSNAGIVYCIECDNVTIKNSNFTNNGAGVYFYKTNNSKIENVIISNNSNNGIYLQYSNNTILQNNYAVNNGNYGIYVSYSNNITLTDNTAIFNVNGIGLSYSNDSNLQRNVASNNYGYMNGNGISLVYSHNNTIKGNIAVNNSGDHGSYGILVSSSNNNTIINNNFSNNGYSYYSGGGISGRVPDLLNKHSER